MLSEHRDLLVTLVDEQLRDTQAVSEGPVGVSILRRRALRLVNALLADLEGEGGDFARYLAELAEAHADDGAFLGALVSALEQLEAHAWDLVAGKVEGASPVADLRRLTRIFGKARDALVHGFLAHKQRAESELARLEARFEAVLSGQVPHGELREDD